MTTRVRGIEMLLLLVACAGCSVRSHAIDLPPIVGMPAQDGAPPSGETHPETGGQSGTDGAGSTGCPPETGRHEVAFDEMTRVGTAQPIRDAFEAALAATPKIPLRWTPEVGGTTTLAIEIGWGAKAILVETSGHVCDALIVPATLHLTTADGVLDEMLPAEMREGRGSGGYDAAAAQHSAIRDELAMRLGEPDLELRSFGVYLSVADGRHLSGMLSATNDGEGPLVGTLYSLAEFDSWWPQEVVLDDPYEHPKSVDYVCKTAVTDASQLQEPDAAHLLDDLDGTWVKCSGASTNDRAHDGIRFASGATWTDLVAQDGKLIELLGFGHEGRLEAWDAQLMMWDALPMSYITPRASLSSDRTTLRLQLTGDNPTRAFDETYVRTDLKVAPARPARADGERAGAAVCEEGEAHVHLFESEADLRARLAGAWNVCAGGFRADATVVVFEEDGTYSQQNESGETISTGKYDVIDTSDANGEGAFQVDMQDDEGLVDGELTVPRMSDAPIKLWAGDEANTVLSAMPAAAD